MSNHTLKKREYSEIPYDTVELQPLQSGKDVSSEGDGEARSLSAPRLGQSQSALFRFDSIAIPLCYLTVGLCQGLNRPLLNVYPLDLGATEAQQATVVLVVMMPGTLKILFGFLSDNYPLFGLRRKPYMLVGWLTAATTMIFLYSSYDLSMSYNVESGDSIPPLNAPTVQALTAAFLLFGTGQWMADVMGDSIVVRVSV